MLSGSSAHDFFSLRHAISSLADFFSADLTLCVRLCELPQNFAVVAVSAQTYASQFDPVFAAMHPGKSEHILSVLTCSTPMAYHMWKEPRSCKYTHTLSSSRPSLHSLSTDCRATCGDGLAYMPSMTPSSAGQWKQYFLYQVFFVNFV